QGHRHPRARTRPVASSHLPPGPAVLRRGALPVRDLLRQADERRADRRRARTPRHPTGHRGAVAVIRLVAYLAGVAAMGTIAQATVGTAFHDAVWTARERIVPGKARIVTETTTVSGETGTITNESMARIRVPGTSAPGRIVPAPQPTTTVTVS